MYNVIWEGYMYMYRHDFSCMTPCHTSGMDGIILLTIFNVFIVSQKVINFAVF